jgi:hypothetical protein
MTVEQEKTALEAVAQAGADVEKAKFIHDRLKEAKARADARYEEALNALEKAHSDLHFALERLSGASASGIAA